MPAANTQYFNLLLLFLSSRVCCCAWDCPAYLDLPSASWLFYIFWLVWGLRASWKDLAWESCQDLSWTWLCCSCLNLWKSLKLYGRLFLICRMRELKYIVFTLLKSLFWTCVNSNPSPKVSALRNWEEIDWFVLVNLLSTFANMQTIETML